MTARSPRRTRRPRRKGPAPLPPPVDRTPPVTVLLLDADRGSLRVRLREVAAQDYAGPIEVFAAASSDPAALARRLESERWVRPLAGAAVPAAAVEQATHLARGTFLALLPPEAHPHALWLDEMVAVALARPGIFGVAPALVRASGSVVAAGVAHDPAGAWSGTSSISGDGPADVAAALGDGLLVAIDALSECFPLDPTLDVRALGIDLSLRARAMERAIVLAPRARVVVPVAGRAPEGQGLRLDERSELLLDARYRPEEFPALLGRSSLLAAEDADGARAFLRLAMDRAGIAIDEALLDILSRSIAEASRRAVSAEGRARDLEERERELTTERHETAVVLHREMSWAHALDDKVRASVDMLARERARHAAEREREQREAALARERLEERLAETERRLAIAERDAELLRIEGGGGESEERVRELEARWQGAETRSRESIQKLTSALDRLRDLESEREEIEDERRSSLDRQAAAENELRSVREWLERAQRDAESMRRLVEQRAQLQARLATAEEGFAASTRLLHATTEDLERTRARAEEAEGRRIAAERALSELQVSFQLASDALREARAEMLTEKEGMQVEQERSQSVVERLATVETEHAALLETHAAAERVLVESRQRLSEAESGIVLRDREIGELGSALRSARERVTALDRRLDAQREDRERLVAELSEISRRATETAAQLAAAAEERDRRGAELDRVRTEMAEARSREAALSEERDALARDLASTRERSEAERARLEAELASTKERLESTTERLGAATDAVARTEAALARERAERTSALREHEEQRSLLERKLAESRQRTDELRVALVESRSRIEDLEGRLHAEQTHAAHLDDRLRTLRREHDSTRATVAERSGDLARLRARMLEERDRLEEQVVALLSEVTKRRWRRRRLSPREEEFLRGPGARFARGPGG